MSEPATEEAPTTVVEVHQEPEQPAEPTTEEHTVVVEQQHEGIHPSVAEFMARTEATLATLASQSEATAAAAADASATASDAAEAVDTAVADVESIAEELTQAHQDQTPAPAAPPEQDVSPHKEHPWFRRRGR